jgi:hypothetical protein
MLLCRLEEEESEDDRDKQRDEVEWQRGAVAEKESGNESKGDQA